MGLFRPGQTLDNGAIEIIDQLGAGGFGEVYLGLWRRPEGHQRIAIKCFNTTGMSQHNLMAAQLLHRESVLIGALDHPGAVKILAAAMEGSIPYLIEEYLPGKDLAQLLAERRAEKHRPVLDPLEILQLGMQIAKALEIVHGKGIFHGDLKPSNICFRDEERSEVVLVDFGHGGFYDSQLLEQNVAGTLAYLPPERTGFVKLAGNAASDLYSLGITLYEAATGEPPFRSKVGRELIAMMLSEVPKPLSQIFPGFPEALSDIIQKLLRKNPDERYHSAFGLFSDFERCRDALQSGQNLRSFALGTKDKLRELNYKIPMVGRQRELDILNASLTATLKGQGACYFIGAPSGVGKSRLAHEMMHRGRSQQLMVMAAKFSEFERNLPLSAFSLMLMEHAYTIQSYAPPLRQSWMKQVKERLGPRGQLLAKRFGFYEGILPAFPPLQPEDIEDESHAFHATLAEFLTLLYPEGAGLVILLDDLQWADWQSLAVVRELCLLGLRDGMGSTLFLGTYRSNEVDERHPLHYQVLQELPQRQQIDLGPLSRHESDELVHHLLDENGPEISRLQEATYQLTAGNPFHIYEYLKSAIASSVFDFDEQTKTWSFSAERAKQSGLTQGVAGLVAERIKRLTGLSRDLILAASVAGNSVSLEALTSLLRQLYPDLSEDTVAWQRQLELACDELVHKHLILPHDRKLIFFHDKIREAAYEQVDLSTRREYHRAYGYWLSLSLLDPEAHGTTQKDYFEAAFHIMEGYAQQDAPLNRRLLFKAAKAAAAVYAYSKAREFLRFASDLFPEDFDQDPELIQEWVALHELWADLLAVSEQIDDALKLYDQVLRYVEDPVQRAQIYARKTEYNLTMFRYKDSLDAVMAGLKALDERIVTKEWHAWLYILATLPFLTVYAIWFHFFGRQTKEIANERERILLHLRIKLEIPFYFSYPMIAIANVIPVTFRILAYKDNPYRATVFAYWGIALAPFGFDRLARSFLSRGADYFDRTNNPVDKGFILFCWGYVHDFMLGNLKSAQMRLTEAVKTLTPVGESFWRSLSLMALIHIDQYGGENGQAKQLTSELVELWKRIRYTPTPLGCCLRVYLQDKREDQMNQLIQDTFNAKNEIRREGFDSIDTVFACVAPGEIYFLREDYKAADPLFREAFASTVKHGHRAAYSLLAPVLYAWNLTRMKRPGRAFVILLLCWLNQLLRARVFYAQTLYATGEWLHLLGFRMIGCWVIQKGIRWAFQRGWLVIVAEGRKLLGRLQTEYAADLAEVNLQLAREYYVERDQAFSVEQCDALLSICRFTMRDSLPSQQLSQRSRTMQGQRAPLLRQRLESHALLEVFLKLSVLTGREELLDALLEALCVCTGAELGLVFLKSREGWEPTSARNLDLKMLSEHGYYKLGIDRAFLENCWEQALDTARIRPPQWQKNEQLSRGSVLVLPLVYRKTVYGYCYLANSQIYDLFDSRSMETVAPLCAQAAIALQNLQLITETQEKVKLDAEMMAARAMQESLLPHHQTLPGLGLSTYYKSASQTGGDWLGYFYHEPLDTAFVCIGDVTGHGIPSALITGVVCGAVYASEFWLGQSVGHSILERLQFLARAVNETVCRTGTRSGCFMTMCFLAIDRKNGRIHVLNAGHNLPYLIQGNSIHILKSRGNRLGHTHDPQFTVHTQSWSRGDRLFLYTDGLVENQGPSGQILKTRQLERVLVRDCSLDDLQKSILATAEKVWQDNPPEDDVSFLLLEWPEEDAEELKSVG
jgi:serine/threonine protein kinase/serine phosphatase RsbU (regulator of sigma subunit)